MNHMFKPSAGSVAGADRVYVGPSTTTSTGAATTVRERRRAPLQTTPESDKSVENAVYGHIRAIRALGRTEILPSEIAAALSLPTTAVLEALTALQSKGVKFSK